MRRKPVLGVFPPHISVPFAFRNALVSSVASPLPWYTDLLVEFTVLPDRRDKVRNWRSVSVMLDNDRLRKQHLLHHELPSRKTCVII
jgi:hypothetical protein